MFVCYQSIGKRLAIGIPCCCIKQPGECACDCLLAGLLHSVQFICFACMVQCDILLLSACPECCFLLRRIIVSHRYRLACLRGDHLGGEFAIPYIQLIVRCRPRYEIIADDLEAFFNASYSSRCAVVLPAM